MAKEGARGQGGTKVFRKMRVGGLIIGGNRSVHRKKGGMSGMSHNIKLKFILISHPKWLERLR